MKVRRSAHYIVTTRSQVSWTPCPTLGRWRLPSGRARSHDYKTRQTRVRLLDKHSGF